MDCSDPATAVCQSCSMPLTAPADFGSEVDGTPCPDYCRFCYQQGSFTAPNLALADMIERLVEFAPQMGLSPEEARKVAEERLPKLRRWRQG